MCTWDLLSRAFLSDPFLRVQVCQWRCLDQSGYQVTWHLVKEGAAVGELSVSASHTLLSQPAVCRTPCQQDSLGFLGLGLTRVPCGSISKRFLCCWKCICNPAFSNFFLVGSDLSDFISLYTLSQASCMYLSSLVSALSDFANTVPGASPFSQY